MQDPAKIPALVGVDKIAKLFRVSPNTAYSWAARGQLGTADAKLSSRSLWLLDRFPDAPDPKRLDLVDKGPRPPLPVVLAGPAELAAAFNVQARTIEAWRRRARDLPAGDPLRPPEPLLIVSLTPVWVAADWRPYAAARGKPFDLPTLTAWRKAQKAAVSKKLS